jgi:hypothetical protein
MNETSRPPGGPPHPQQRVASRPDKRARRSPSFYDFIDLEQEVERLAREAFAGALDDLRLEEPEGPRIGGRGSSLGIGGRPSVNANSPSALPPMRLPPLPEPGISPSGTRSRR